MRRRIDLAGTLLTQLKAQSEFCSSIGSVLGNYLWDLSRCPQIALSLTQKDRLGELLELCRCAVLSYVAACKRNNYVWLGGLSKNESMLTISLVGIVANLAAVDPSLILNCGSELISDLIEVVKEFSTEPLTKIILEMLYNLSLNEAGAALLQESAVMGAIERALDCGSDVHLSAVKLLASITSHSLSNYFTKQIPNQRVRNLYHMGDIETAHYASIILKNMESINEMI